MARSYPDGQRTGNPCPDCAEQPDNQEIPTLNPNPWGLVGAPQPSEVGWEVWAHREDFLLGLIRETGDEALIAKATEAMHNMWPGMSD